MQSEGAHCVAHGEILQPTDLGFLDLWNGWGLFFHWDRRGYGAVWWEGALCQALCWTLGMQQ